MTIQDTNDDGAGALALGALGWTLSDQSRAERLLALTGLTPDALRAGLDDPSLLAAIIRNLESYEPDLIACAEDISTTPAALVEARRRLER